MEKFRLLVSFILLSLSGFVYASQIVAEAVFVIGTPELSKGDFKTTLVKGMKIEAGVVVQTGPGSHVHFRFLDQSVVSVRPNTQLRIDSFEYQQADLKQFKITVTEGSVRTVSGEGVKAAKDRFRLNTPIAAIGVRGTDFSVVVSDEHTDIDVHSGEILVAKFGEGCSPQTLGPCEVKAARSLVGGSSDGLRVLPGQANIISLPRALLQRNSGGVGEKNIEDRRKDKQDDQKSSDVIDESNERRIQELLPYTQRPIPFNDTTDDLIDQSERLLWGHWFAPPRGDTWSPSAIDLLSTFQPTVSNANYGLFREFDYLSGFNPIVPRVALQLSGADATYTESARGTRASLTEGYLLLDFTNSSFLSQIGVMTDRAGNIVLNGAGLISPNGVFVSRSNSDRMAGALTEDGLEAGLLFEKRLDSGGVLQGISTWSQ
ncbi:FecR family protein [Litoricolaceae bacterium]|nr:FecR family protein [Litorivicinaceae bacterium]